MAGLAAQARPGEPGARVGAHHGPVRAERDVARALAYEGRVARVAVLRNHIRESQDG